MPFAGATSRLALPIAALLGLHAGPASATDCAKPKGQLRKAICGDEGFRTAEEAMAKAYRSAMDRMPDREARDLLLAAQRRWVSAREAAWGGEAVEDDAHASGEAELAELLRHDAVRQANFARGFAANLARERAFAAEFTGGRHAGAKVECSRSPAAFGGGSHLCTGYLSMQHHDRVCTAEIQWASGHDASRRSVQRAGPAGLEGVAACNLGWGSGTPCPMGGKTGPEAGWERDDGFRARSPAGTAPGEAAENLPSFALDLGSFAQEAGWMRECLTAVAYPDPGLVRPASGRGAR